MTKSDTIKKMQDDFGEEEYNRLRKKPIETIHNMSKADKIIIEGDLIYYLRDFCVDYYKGEPIPKVFSQALIEWNRPTGMYRFFVTFPEHKPDYIFVDVFYLWDFLGKVILPNWQVTDYQDSESGQKTYMMMTAEGNKDESIYDMNAIDNILGKSALVFLYAYTYVHANKDVVEIYTEETIYPEKNTLKQNKKKKKKQNKNPLEREKVFVPKKRRIYKVKRTETVEKNLREYIYSRWKVRGYTYTRGDGKVISVKEHYKHRHLPNKGIEKTGKDYILQEREKVAE